MSSSSHSSPPMAAQTPPPNLTIPPSPSNTTVTLHLLNTHTSRVSPASDLFTPAIPGFTTVPLPSWIFLITHPPSGKRILFDLGIRKNWNTGFPPVFTPEILESFHITGHKDVSDVLEVERETGVGVRVGDIESVIWSHHHFDHRGDITVFPKGTELVVGPGVRKAYPTYPGDREGEIWEAEFEGRAVRELRQEEFGLDIGGFRAVDWFEDGSFYVLSTPGHTVGHLSALARVTAGGRDTFVFMAGDVAHHPGVFRPSPYIPLADRIEIDGEVLDGRKIVDKLHPKKDARSPFINVDEEPMCHDHAAAVDSVRKMQAFDACEDILVCIAHDSGLEQIIPVFPQSMNEWKAQGWKEKLRWRFLSQFDTSQCQAY